MATIDPKLIAKLDKTADKVDQITLALSEVFKELPEGYANWFEEVVVASANLYDDVVNAASEFEADTEEK